MNGQITLKNIADACGISVAAVSQIMNNKTNSYIAETTRKKVREMAGQLGYKKNFLYSLMRGEKTRTVGIMIHMHRGMHEEYLRELVLALMQELERRDYACYIAVLGSDKDENIRKTREFLSRGVSSFIMLQTPIGFREITKIVTDAGCLLTGISEYFKRYVMVDTVSGFCELLGWVRGKVKENYRVMMLPDNHSSPRDKVIFSMYPKLKHQEVLRRYFRDLLPFPDDPKNFQEEAFQAGLLTAERILKAEPEVRALVCSNDSFAIGAATGCMRSGKIVGKDIFVTGFNNDSNVRFFPVPITTVSLEWVNYVPRLVDAALSTDPCQQKFEAKLIIRTI